MRFPAQVPEKKGLLRYHSLKTYLNRRFGGPVAKISLDAGLTCPNRDGRLSTKGCLFCDQRGSGTGAADQGLSLAEQVRRGAARAGGRGRRFMAYFQSYTNTYAPLEQLRSIWDQALDHPEVVGLAVGTRPDCLPDEVLDLLAGYLPGHEVWLELGLQSALDRTLDLINRGHTARDFAEAAVRARARGLKVLAHIIIGLPGEGPEEVLTTARFLAGLQLDGVKIHSLYVTQGTGLAEMFSQGAYQCLTREEYVDLVILFLENIPLEMVIHRLTGDPDPNALLAPDWSLDKHRTLNLIRKRLEELDAWQGRALGNPRQSLSD